MQLAISRTDAVILLAYLAAVVALGIRMGRGKRNMADYLLAGRNIPGWGVLLSIVATETSTVTFLIIPGIAYEPDHGDLRFLQLAIGLIVGRLIVVFLFLPLRVSPAARCWGFFSWGCSRGGCRNARHWRAFWAASARSAQWPC